MKKSLDWLFANRRHMLYIDPDRYVEGHGYRVSIIFAREPGQYPTGDWPYDGKPEQRMPWFYGPTLEDAKAACREQNRMMGLSEEDEFAILASSMGAQFR